MHPQTTGSGGTPARPLPPEQPPRPDLRGGPEPNLRGEPEQANRASRIAARNPEAPYTPERGLIVAPEHRVFANVRSPQLELGVAHDAMELAGSPTPLTLPTGFMMRLYTAFGKVGLRQTERA